MTSLSPREPLDEVASLIDELVTANQILSHLGVVDGYGHVSARHPRHPDRFLLSRSMPPEQVSADDVLEFTLDSELVTPSDHRIFLERFIHGEVYRARPDVLAVVHSHSHAVVPLGIAKHVSLRAVYHMGAFLGVHTPVFEIRDVRGDGTDMLVRDSELGRALAACLGNGTVVLMRGHGATVVGSSLRHAVVYAAYTEINARLQTQAMQLGQITYLSEAEARAAAAVNAAHLDRPWDLWKAQARRALNG